jgi:hypothetical protein
MKRLFGLLLTLAGGATVLWGGFHVLTGESKARIPVTDDFAITALMGGLIGVLVFTLGLIWVRD